METYTKQKEKVHCLIMKKIFWYSSLTLCRESFVKLIINDCQKINNIFKPEQYCVEEKFTFEFALSLLVHKG